MQLLPVFFHTPLNIILWQICYIEEKKPLDVTAPPEVWEVTLIIPWIGIKEDVTALLIQQIHGQAIL